MNISFEEEQTQPEPQPLSLRFLFALALGTLTLAVGAVVWGLVAYFSNSVFFIIAVFIGMAAAAATLLPLRPIRKSTALVFLPVAILGTLASIMLGESIYVVLFLMRDTQATLAEALTAVADGLGEILSSSDSVTSGIFGLIGSVVGFFSIWRQL
jgi:hypothetical protein